MGTWGGDSGHTIADNTVINFGGLLALMDDATIHNTTISRGGVLSCITYSGRPFSDSKITGQLVVNGGIIICEDSVPRTIDDANAEIVLTGNANLSRAMFQLNNGASVTIRGVKNDAGYINIKDNGVLNYDLTRFTTPNHSAMLTSSESVKANNITVTVDTVNNAPGVYKLADNASLFDETITVYNNSTLLGDITIDSPFINRDKFVCALNIVNDTLTFMTGFDKTAPKITDQLIARTKGHRAFLSWATSSDNLSGTAFYTVEYAANNLFSDAVSHTVPSTDFKFTALNGTYYWRVKAIDRTNNISLWSEIQSVTIDATSHSSSDFNSDGYSDLLFRNHDNGIVGSWSKGNSNEWQSLGNAGVANWEFIANADFSGNGTDDILWQNRVSGAVGIWENGQSSSWNGFGLASRADWQIAGTGDITGNGTDDIIWRNLHTGYTGTWESGQIWQGLGAVGIDWKFAGTGDFNGDGTDNILWRNQNSGLTGTWNNGNEWHELGSVSTAWEIEGTGDFNGNGSDDILWRNNNSGQVGIWESGQSNNWQSRGIVPNDWQIAGFGDFNGNSTADIVWHNQLTGDVGIWESSTDWQSLGNISADWQICNG